MAKRTVSFGDYKPSEYEEYTGEAPPANQWFTGEVVRATYLEEDDQMRFSIQLVDNPDYEGWGKGWFAPFEGNLKWKMHEILRAMQGGQEKDVTLDWTNEAQVAAFIKKSKRFRFKTEMYNDDIKIKTVRPLLEAAGAKGTGAKASAPKEAELPGDTDAGDEPLEDYTEEELGEMEVAELQEILKEEFSADVPAKKRRGQTEDQYKDVLIDEILDAQEEANAEEGAEGDSEADEEFEDGFPEDPEPEPEPEPEPAPRTRRTRAAAKPAPEPESTAPTTRTRRTRR